jgi:hypothetical protein
LQRLQLQERDLQIRREQQRQQALLRDQQLLSANQLTYPPVNQLIFIKKKKNLFLSKKFVNLLT